MQGAGLALLIFIGLAINSHAAFISIRTNRLNVRIKGNYRKPAALRERTKFDYDPTQQAKIPVMSSIQREDVKFDADDPELTLRMCIKTAAAASGAQLLAVLQDKERLLSDLDNFSSFSKEMETMNNTLMLITQDLGNTRMQAILYQLQNVSNNLMNFDILTATKFLPVINCTRQLNSTEDIGDNIRAGFLEAQIFINSSIKWYSYLPTLYEAFTDYEVQNNKTFTFLALLTFLRFNGDQSIEELEKHLNLKFPADISSVVLNEAKRDNLINVLNAILYNPNSITCSSNIMTVTGSFIRLSEVVIHPCFLTASQVEILAAVKLFIDTDFTKHSGRVLLASPTWDVRGSREISVDGDTGENPVNARHFPMSQSGRKGSGSVFVSHSDLRVRVSDSLSVVKGRSREHISPFDTVNTYGFEVYDGLPGGPGRPGGEFFGIGHIFINAENVLISANGGNGGKGQNGGEGVAGRTETFIDDFGTSDVAIGGEGGAGGVGGNPGPAGVVNILSIGSDTPAIEDSQISELAGAIGPFGIGGSGGHYDGCSSDPDIGCFDVRGDDGPSNSNSGGIESPEPPLGPIYKSISTILKFKRTIRKEKKTVLGNKLRLFYELLESDSSITAFYDSASPFFDEFEDLEKDYKSVDDYSLFYFESLLKRINSFDCEATDGSCQDLRYLRLALMSILAEGRDEYFVVNIHDYLELLLKHIGQYRTSIHEIDIRQQNEDYTLNILSDIGEANNFITSDVIPDIDKASNEMSSEMQRLVEEVEELLNEAEIQLDKLEEQKKKMKLLGFLNVFFNVLGFVSKAVQFIPGANLIGAAVDAGIGIGSSIVSGKIDEIKQKAIDAEGKIDKIFIKEQEFIQKRLTDLASEVESNTTPEAIFVKSRIEDFQKAIKDSVTNYTEMKKNIQNDIQEYKNENDGKENKYVDKLSDVMSAVQTGLTDVANAVGQNNEAKSEIDQAIRETEEEISVLKSYENTIYNTLMPMIDDMRDNLVNAANQTSLSHAQINIVSMRVDSALSDFKVQLDNMVAVLEDPTIKTTIMGCIEKLRSAMKTAASLFDRIANCHDQANLANYIADIQSDSSGISTRQLQFESLAKINIITKEFGQGINAFKQFSFPFVSLYLDRFDVPPSDSQNDTLLINDVSAKINFLMDELVKEATVVRNEGYTIFPLVNFDTSGHSQPPFYVWENKLYQSEISLLLGGNKVAMTAKLNMKNSYLNAIKFKEVGIRFVSSNQTLQDAIDKAMDGFLVTMTHLGSSYFKCDDRNFVIYHNKVKMTHSVNRYNNDYDQPDQNTLILRNNPAMCSPYTKWILQISSKFGCADCIEDLKDFIGAGLDLALEGDGQFIDIPIGNDFCGKDVDKYYETAEGEDEVLIF